MCEAKCSVNSDRSPVSMLTTPAGTSEACRTSAKLTADSGIDSEASTTQVLPPTIVGATFAMRPSRPLSSGAMIDTTPVGSSTVKLKCDDATGFTALNTCWYLSDQPAK